MRHLKVRIWDGKKYHYPEATKEEANHYLQLGSEGFWLYNSLGKMITASEVGGICEEFTGLKDKNGKEIYEGDICEVKYIKGSGFPSIKGEVKWFQLHAHFAIYSEGSHYSPSMGGSVIDGIYVIGNIHENPELL